MTTLELLAKLNARVTELQHTLRIITRQLAPPSEIDRIQTSLTHATRERDSIENAFLRYTNRNA
jgi:hypothetical protein